MKEFCEDSPHKIGIVASTRLRCLDKALDKSLSFEKRMEWYAFSRNPKKFITARSSMKDVVDGDPRELCDVLLLMTANGSVCSTVAKRIGVGESVVRRIVRDHAENVEVGMAVQARVAIRSLSGTEAERGSKGVVTKIYKARTNRGGYRLAEVRMESGEIIKDVRTECLEIGKEN